MSIFYLPFITEVMCASPALHTARLEPATSQQASLQQPSDQEANALVSKLKSSGSQSTN